MKIEVSSDPYDDQLQMLSSQMDSKLAAELNDSSQMTGGRLIAGKLQEISLADLLQMLGTTRKTGQLVLSDRRMLKAPSLSSLDNDTSIVFLKDGQITNALFGQQTGEAAFYSCLRRAEGHFALFPLNESEPFPEEIDFPVEALLLEGFRRMDEEKARHQHLDPQDELQVKPDEPLSSLAADELAIFQLAWKYAKVSKVIERSQKSKDETLNILDKLVRLQFIQKKS
jgi:hypothetical protein